MSLFRGLIRQSASHDRTSTEIGGQSRNALHQAATTTEVPSSAMEQYGLKTMIEHADDIVDIVFVHGLTGRRESTWSAVADNSVSVFWPRDLLADDLPRARIITFGYDADVVRGLTQVGNGTLRDHGNTLAEDLAIDRLKMKTKSRPLIFVAHSLGGLVVEQALLCSRRSAQPHVKNVLDSTVGLIFMGTPHLGSDLAKWAHLLTRVLGLLRRTNSEIVRVLAPGSDMLATVQTEFQTMLRDVSENNGKKIDIYCFYEEVACIGIGKIVPKVSAILPGYPHNSIHATHTGMTKFGSARDDGYVRVQSQLWGWYERIRKVQEECEQRPENGNGQNQRPLRPTGTIGSDHPGTTYRGPVFNGPISGRTVIPGTQINGGTNHYNFS